MDNLTVSCSPHIKSSHSTAKIMRDVVIAMLPALAASVWFFGWRALILTLVCVASCVLFEYLFCLVAKRKSTISDCSAVVTGMLLAFNLPVTFPIWMTFIGSFAAIVIVKMLFGGIGQNFANPALVGRVVLMLSFGEITHFVKPADWFYGDAMASATPLANMGAGTSIFDAFIGNIAGCVGETSALAIIIGFIYLLARKVISPIVPLTFVGSAFLFTWMFSKDLQFSFLSIFLGGLMLGATFMATDYCTSPITGKGKFIFALGCGLITAVIRVFGTYPEGVSFAILLMNLLVPYIDKLTRTKPFGAIKPGKKTNKA